MPKKVLVTGGAGTIGRTLSRALIELGYEVIVIDDDSSGIAEWLPSEATFIRGSICVKEVLDQAFRLKPHYVFHLAALFANQNSVENPQYDLEVNGQGLLRMLEYSGKAECKKFLYTSSSCVYGNRQPMVEDSPLDAVDTPYAISKRLGEDYCRFWSHFHQVQTIIARVFNCYGPGDIPGKFRNVIPNFFSDALCGKPLTITGDGNEVRDFVFIDDLIQGLLKAMFTQTKSGEIFNLATGVGTKIKDIATTINTLTSNPSGLSFLPRRRWDSVDSRIGVSTKAREQLGFNPTIKIEEGLRRTWQWFRKIKLPSKLSQARAA